MVMPGVHSLTRSIPSHSINLSLTKPMQWEPTYQTRYSPNYPTYPTSRKKYTTEGVHPSRYKRGDNLGINVILEDDLNLSLRSNAVFHSIDRKWKKERQNGYIQKSKTCADCTGLRSSSEPTKKKNLSCRFDVEGTGRQDFELQLRSSKNCLDCKVALEDFHGTECQCPSVPRKKECLNEKGNVQKESTNLQSTKSISNKGSFEVEKDEANAQLPLTNEIKNTGTPGIRTQPEKVVTKLWRSNESFTEYKCKKDQESKKNQEFKKDQGSKNEEQVQEDQESKKTYVTVRDEFVEPVNVHPPTKTVELPTLVDKVVPPERHSRAKRRSLTGVLYVPPLSETKTNGDSKFSRDLKTISRSYSAPLPDISDIPTDDVGRHGIQSPEPLKPPRKNRRSLKALQLTPVLERGEDCHADGSYSESNMNCRKGPAHKYMVKEPSGSGSCSKMGAPYEEPSTNKYRFNGKQHPQYYGVESVQENLATDSGPDQGYSSERSPEEEEETVDEQLVGRKKRRNVRCEQKNKTGSGGRDVREANSASDLHIHHVAKYIDSDSVFEVTLEKSSRGLGLSVETCGDLVRVRKLYPLQPASQSQQILLGDVILYANGNPLTGLTTNEALEVLRTLGQHVVLTVFRPPPGLLPSLPGVTSPLTPCLLTIPVDSAVTGGEFNITLSKVNGSLGFTLRKQDESILGHYVRALVREPAISDGRIRPGDRILTVNGTDLSDFSHKEAVNFLRTCPDIITLRLYRDPTQTPVSPSSPTEHNDPTFPKKPLLRKEAVDMLTDLAIQRSSPNNSPVRNRRIGSSGSPLHRSKQAKLRQLSCRSASTHTYPLSATEGVIRLKPDITVEPPTPSPDKTIERPNFLDLESSENRRKDKFLFTPETEYCSLPTQGLLQDDSNSSPSTGTSATSSDVNFSHNKHNYQSVNLSSSGMPQYSNGPMSLTNSDQDLPGGVFGKKDGKEGLLKWRGSVFHEEEEDTNNQSESAGCNELTVELVRGWSSRLGFSIKSCPKGSYISAIYPDSVAYRDGRLRENDVLLTVNGELVVNKRTEDVIDLMRKVGGKVVVITVEQGGNLPERNNNS